MKTVARLITAFAIAGGLNAPPANAGWKDTIDGIFPPITSPTQPEPTKPELLRLSGIKETFNTVIENKGVPFKGGVIQPFDYGLRFKMKI